MSTREQRVVAGTRTRQYISFAILAMFLGLFVSAMTKDVSLEQSMPPVRTVRQAHMVLSLPASMPYSHSVDEKSHTLRLSFPGISAMQLKRDYMHPHVIDAHSPIRGVQVRESSKEEGAQLLLRLCAQAKVRLLRFTKPDQLMINVVHAPQSYDYKMLAHHEMVYRLT